MNIEEILNFVKMGLAVFPLQKRSKKPATKNGVFDATLDEAKIREWWTRWPDNNIGIACGSASNNLVVIDVDYDKEKGTDGYLSLSSWEREHGKLPETSMSITGRGGSHIFFRTDGRNVPNSVSLYEGIDIRSNGGFIVAPGSIHPNGRAYEWESPPNETPIAIANDIVYQFLHGPEKEKPETRFKMPDEIRQGQRTRTLFKLACSLQAKGLTDAAIKAALYEENRRCIPPLTDDEIQKEVLPALKRYEKPKLNLANGEDMDFDYTPFHFYDDKGRLKGANHYAIAENVKQNYSIFVCGGVPYVYESGVYRADFTGTKLKSFIKRRIEPNLRKSQTINQIYGLLMDDYELEKDFRDLNSYPASCTNFKDCMYDSATQTKMEHSPKYYAINQVPWDYEEIMKAPVGENTEKFLQFAIPDKQDREMTLQFGGLCTTPDTRQQASFWTVGPGNNGKSILLRMFEEMVGSENTTNIGVQDLSKRFSTSLLVGRLLNSCSDLPLDAIEETGTFKKLTGEDEIFAERKGCQGFMFRSYAKLVFSTNLLPVVQGERNHAFFRRLRILKMDRVPQQIDTDLFSKLQKELPYFIRLCLEALQRMYQDGTVMESENSKKLVRQMEADSDTTSAFINECCTLGEQYKTDRKKLYQAYSNYCEDADRQALSRNSFFKALRAKGLSEVRGKTEYFFTGIIDEKITVKNHGTDENGFTEVTEDELGELPFT